MVLEHAIIIATLVALNMYAVVCCLRNGRGTGTRHE